MGHGAAPTVRKGASTRSGRENANLMHDVAKGLATDLRLVVTANTLWAAQAMGLFLQSVAPGCRVTAGAEVTAVEQKLEQGCCDVLVIAAMTGAPEQRELVARVAERWPEPPKLLATADLTPDLMRTAQDLGVTGYLTTDTEPACVQLALAAVANGETHFPPLGEEATSDSGRPQNIPDNIRERLPRLTRRERQVMELLGQGYANREIAEMLDLREGTVRIYVHRVIRQLGLRNRVDVALCANYVNKHG